MADERQLNHLYEGMEASEAEMAVYRRGLGDRLLEQRSWRDYLSWWQLLLAPALALLLWVAFPPEKAPTWYQSSSLEALLAGAEEVAASQLRSQAEQAFQREEGQAAANARALLILTMEREGAAIDLASEGLEQEPRPEFRRFYLEWLLDRFDHYQWNTARYEALMEQEDDPVCLSLYEAFLEAA